MTQNNHQQSDQTGSQTPNTLLTRDDVALHYGISKRWLELAACRGDGPPIVRITPRMVRYRTTDIEDWIARHVDTGTN